MRELYGALRIAIAGSAIFILGAQVPATARCQDLPAAPRPANGHAAADSVDAYLVGAWHLSQAIGRMACSGTLTPQLRALMERDLDWTQRAMEAQTSCAPRGRFA